MTENNNQEAAFLPFHAVNHFMRDDFRKQVVREAVLAMKTLPSNLRSSIDQFVRKHVSVPGFRNSAKAPASLKARHLPDAFEKNPGLVAAILSAWAEVKSELRQQVFDLLLEREWEILPVDADRTRLPGFLTTWPPNEDFESINQAFAEKHPDVPASSDDVSLMTVWLSGRLPVDEAE